MRLTCLIAAVFAFAACQRMQRDLPPSATAAEAHAPPPSQWMAGVSIADEPGPYDSPEALTVYDHLVKQGVRAVALTPAAYLPDLHKPGLRWREHAHIREGVIAAHNKGLAVLIKPYIWSHVFFTQDTMWTGKIEMFTEDDWRSFFKTYQEFTLTYARIAEETHAELFSIGLEYPKTFSRTTEWNALIAAVRNVYHGPITYASTGVDEAETVPFWKKLDVIGIDAFVPLTDDLHPTKEMLCESWKSYVARLEAIHQKYNKPIMFTEAGYKSCVGAACRPWEWNEHTPHPLDLQQQSVCYDALATSLFNKPWFAGIFWWKYFTSMNAGGTRDNDFCPLGKPAEKMMKAWFVKKRSGAGGPGAE